MSITSQLEKEIIWEAKLEEPSEESGATVHKINLPADSKRQDVVAMLLKMKLPGGTQRYHEQDVQKPYLHYIRKLN